MGKTVYIMVGDAVVSDSSGKPRVFSRSAARSYKRNHFIKELYPAGKV